MDAHHFGFITKWMPPLQMEMNFWFQRELSDQRAWTDRNFLCIWRAPYPVEFLFGKWQGILLYPADTYQVSQDRQKFMFFFPGALCQVMPLEMGVREISAPWLCLGQALVLPMPCSSCVTLHTRYVLIFLVWSESTVQSVFSFPLFMGHLKKQHVPCSGHSILHLLLRNTSSITGKQIQIFLAQVFYTWLESLAVVFTRIRPPVGCAWYGPLFL